MLLGGLVDVQNAGKDCSSIISMGDERPIIGSVLRCIATSGSVIGLVFLFCSVIGWELGHRLLHVGLL